MANALKGLMKLPAYPKYKPSGVEWLGDVPEHWEVKRLRRVLAESLQYGANESAELDDPDLPRYVRITDVHENGTLRPDTFRSLSKDIAAPYLLKDGDILFARSGATSGKTFLYQNSWGICAYAGYLIRARMNQQEAVPAFVKYFTTSTNYWQWLSSVFIQSTIQNVSAEKYADLQLSLPPLPEQTAIAAFLDQQTMRIDTLIAKKRELIERLKEKRTALISCTVTRGLNPKVKLKPSGVEWLGDVPEHWEVRKFSREVAIAEGQVDPEKEPYASMLLIGPEHVESGTGRLLQQATASDQRAESGKYLSSKGDVIYSKIRPALRKLVIAPEDCLCSADMYPLRGRNRVENQFLAWFFLSEEFSGWSVLESDRVAMPKINRDTLNELRMPLPPLSEQTAIAAYLDQETAKLDALVAKVEEAVERLQEYRTSLITAAVTGKIDVRKGFK